VLNKLYVIEANGCPETVEVSKISVLKGIVTGDLEEKNLVSEDTSVGGWELSKGGQAEEQSFWPDVAEEDAQNINDDREEILRTQRSNAWSVKKRGMSYHSGRIV
jgi:hypothetical protein